MSDHHEPAKAEFSNPVLWTVALLAFTIGTGIWFVYWMGKGGIHARNNPHVTESTAPTETIPDHAALIGKLDADVLKKGKKIYSSNCVTCHGADGKLKLAGARDFSAEAFKNEVNGEKSHPWSMFHTLTNGFGNGMSPFKQLSVEDRYAVIHYVRETFVKEANKAQYVTIDEALKADFPAPQAGSGEAAAGPNPAFNEIEVPIYAVLEKTSAAQKSTSAWLANLETQQSNTALKNAVQSLKTCASSQLGDQIDQQLQSGTSEQLLALLLAPEVAAMHPSFASLSKQEFQQLYTTLTAARSK